MKDSKKPYLIALILMALLLAFGLDAAAQTFEETNVALSKKDYAKAAAGLQVLAEKGDPRAQSNLGALYENGLGVPKDAERAVGLYQRAADQGLPVAQFNLAEMYLKGLGAKKDEKQAFELYKKAAEHGLGEAQYKLGVLYTDGTGAPKDPQQAYFWLTVASANGSKPAKEALQLADRSNTLSAQQRAKAKAEAAAWQAKRPVASK
jgi:TPR repeat protein